VSGPVVGEDASEREGGREGGRATYLVTVGEEGLLVLVLDDLEGVKAQVAADVVLLHAGDLGLIIGREGGGREG